MTVKMDDQFAAHLRAALVEHVEATPVRERRTRRHTALGAGIGILILGGGVAYAAGILGLAGADVVTPLAASVTVTGEGTQTVELGIPPAGTTDIDLTLTCLTAGTFFTADGASLQCDRQDAGTGQMGWQLPVQVGQHATVIRAGDAQRWRLTATYAQVSTSDWAVNANRQTYGVANDNGTPDLVAAIATNGKTGYVYAHDLQTTAPTALQSGTPPGQTRTIPVYTSDGHTEIGQYLISSPVDEAPTR